MELAPASRVVSSRFGVHGWVIAVLVTSAAILSLVLWLHPTAGYARGGILDGADLRGWMIQLLGWMTMTFAASSTVVLAFAPLRWRRGRHALAYAVAIAACAAMVPVLDKLY